MDNVLALEDVSLDTDEMDRYNQGRRIMLQNISGDVDAHLMKAYGSDGGGKTLESVVGFYEDNKRNFLIYLWSKTLAMQEHAPPTEKKYHQALAFYCLAYDTTEEQVEQERLREEALRSFYMQYGIGRLRDYYKSIVYFSAVGIPFLPRRG